jgi:hypothetical protein
VKMFPFTYWCLISTGFIVVEFSGQARWTKNFVLHAAKWKHIALYAIGH